MAADMECGFLLASVGEGLRQYGIAPGNTGDAQIIKTLRMEIDQQQRLRSMALTQLLALKRERDMMAIRLQERQIDEMDAEAAVAALIARADEDGALHRHAMIEVLRSMGAR